MSTKIKNLIKYVDDVGEVEHLSNKEMKEFKIAYRNMEYDKNMNLVKDELDLVDSLSYDKESKTIILG